eukprot:COSAG01_NODE_8448_length_2782_cov_12.650391_2_plen_115_part_00
MKSTRSVENINTRYVGWLEESAAPGPTAARPLAPVWLLAVRPGRPNRRSAGWNLRPKVRRHSSKSLFENMHPREAIATAMRRVRFLLLSLLPHGISKMTAQLLVRKGQDTCMYG